MIKSGNFSALFAKLKAIIEPYNKGLNIVLDDPENYHLDTAFIMKNKKPLFFGAVNIKKNYVSFHLMPVYVNPALLDNISNDLKKRMQGKSCFNFKVIDEALFRELAELTNKGFEFYLSEGYVK